MLLSARDAVTLSYFILFLTSLRCILRLSKVRAILPAHALFSSFVGIRCATEELTSHYMHTRSIEVGSKQVQVESKEILWALFITTSQHGVFRENQDIRQSDKRMVHRLLRLPHLNHEGWLQANWQFTRLMRINVEGHPYAILHGFIHPP